MGRFKHRKHAKAKGKTLTERVAAEAEEFGTLLLALFGEDVDLIRFAKLYWILQAIGPQARREIGFSDELLADLIVALQGQFFQELHCAMAKEDGSVFHGLARAVMHFPTPGARDMTFMRLYKLSQSPGFKNKQWNVPTLQKATGDEGNSEVLRRKAVAFGIPLKPGKPSKVLLASHQSE